MANWIKSGLSVVNITNLDQIMTVNKVVYKSRKLYDGTTEKRVSKIVGVECKSLDSDGKWVMTMHHSKELIPLEVASKGKIEAIRFVNREGDYKDY